MSRSRARPYRVGAAIRAHRLRAGLTLEQLGLMIARAPSTLSEVETGKKLCSEDLAGRLANALDLSIWELIEHPSKPADQAPSGADRDRRGGAIVHKPQAHARRPVHLLPTAYNGGKARAHIELSQFAREGGEQG